MTRTIKAAAALALVLWARPLSAQSMDQLEKLAEQGGRAAAADAEEKAGTQARFEKSSGTGVVGNSLAGPSAPGAKPLSLSEKAKLFETRTRKQNMPWFGLVLTRRFKDDGTFNDYTSYADAAIWSGNYVAAEAYRYSATKDTEALAAMEESLKGLVSLHEITGIPGFIARDIVPVAYAEEHGLLKNDDWHKGQGKYAGWAWKGDLSYDQYEGYLFGLAAAWPHIQDPKLKEDVREAAKQIGEHIMGHNMRIKGPGTFLDFRANYFAQDNWPGFLRGLPMPPIRAGNAMHGLHFMKVVATITQDPRFEDYYVRHMMGEEELDVALKKYGPAYEDDIIRQYQGLASELVKFNYGSDVQITTASMRSDISQNLSHMALYDLLHLEGDPDLRALYKGLFAKVHKISEDDANTYWNFLYARQFKDDPRAVKDGIDTLRRFPISTMFGEVKNSEDPAYPKYKAVNSNSYKGYDPAWRWYTTRPIPFERRNLHTAFAWQSNPYELDGGDRNEEGSGAAYLVAYWMGRDFGYIKPGD